MDQNRNQRENESYNLRMIFEEMELDLVRSLQQNLKRHEKEEEEEGFRWEMWQRAKLRKLQQYRKENREIVEEISPEVEWIVNEALEDNYNRGKSLFNRIWNRIKSTFFKRKRAGFPKSISHHKISTPPPDEKDFFSVNKNKIEVMQEEAEKANPEETPLEKEQKKEPKPDTPATDGQEPEETGKPFHPDGKEKNLPEATQDKKLDNMSRQVVNDMKEAQKAVWRRMDDIYRRTIYRAGMNMAAGAKTLDQAVDMATKEFLDAGIDCIEYKNGRRVNIASYAEMALRTASQRAVLLGEGKERDEWGIHTVIVTAHANTCPLCAPWQGKVLVDDVFSSGTPEEAKELGYPLLSMAMKAGLLHPNCRHTISTYFPGITKIPEIPDADKAIGIYKAEQKQRELERKIRKWKRKAEGSLTPENVNHANDKVGQYQEELRIHLDRHPELRREYNREKTRGIPDTLKTHGPSVEKNKEMSLEEEGAIIRYISPSSIALNDKLRLGEELTDFEKEWIMNLNKALEKLPQYKGDLNRSLDFPDYELAQAFFDGLNFEKVFPQYISATKTGIYNPDGQVQIYIQNSKNGRDLKGFNDMENEVLYPINTKFRVVNKVKQGDKFYILLEEAE